MPCRRLCLPQRFAPYHLFGAPRRSAALRAALHDRRSAPRAALRAALHIRRSAPRRFAPHIDSRCALASALRASLVNTVFSPLRGLSCEFGILYSPPTGLLGEEACGLWLKIMTELKRFR
eukprot:6120907-Prymnesium_polylepis.2